MNTSSALCVVSKYNFPLKEPGLFQEKTHFSFGEEIDKLFLKWTWKNNKKSHKLLKNSKVKGRAIPYAKTF